MTYSKYQTKDAGGTSPIPRQTLREEEMQQRLNESKFLTSKECPDQQLTGIQLAAQHGNLIQTINNIEADVNEEFFQKKTQDKVDGGGLRFNTGKLDLNYCPLSAKFAIAAVFSANSQVNGGKYPDNNWRRGQKWSVPLSSFARHCEDFLSGEDLDIHSGLPHIWHMLANLSMLTEYSVTFPEGDDRLSTQNIKTAKMADLLEHYSNALYKNKKRNEK